MKKLNNYVYSNKMAKNPWITFLASYRKSNPGLSMKQAMKQGAKAYKSKGKGKKKNAKNFTVWKTSGWCHRKPPIGRYWRQVSGNPWSLSQRVTKRRLRWVYACDSAARSRCINGLPTTKWDCVHPIREFLPTPSRRLPDPQRKKAVLW